MATLTLNAGTASALTIVCQRAGKGAPRLVGSVTPSFTGALRSTVRGQAKVIPILASYVDTPTEAAIQAAVMNGAQIACSGDILQNIQTLCSIDNVVSNMIPGLAGFFEMSFTVNEVNASTILLKYAAGDTITGEAFTRSTTGYQINSSGVLVSKAINTKRDGHYIASVASLLLEDTRTNLLTAPSDFSNVAWVKTTMTVGTGIADPTGGTSACTLTASAGNASAVQTLAAGSSRARANAVWLRRRTGTGTINVLKADGSVYVAQTLTGTWQRFSVAAGAVSTARVAGIQIVTNGDAVDVYDYDLEDFNFVTSDPPGTRGADFYSMPFTFPPGELTVYVKFVESGSIATGGNVRVWSITSAAGAGPVFQCFANTGYTAQHHNNISGPLSTLATTPVIGDTVELMCRLFGDGSVDITQSINGAASTSAAQTVANALQSAWAGQLFWLNSLGTVAASNGYGAYQSVKIAAGARSLTEMRAA